MAAGRCRREDGGYAIVENMAVLPVVFLVVYALLFAGFILHARCTIESAAKRGVLYGGRLVCDPQYRRVTAAATDPAEGELNEISGKAFDFSANPGISYQPYRYIPVLNGSYFADINTDVENYVRKILGQSSTWMFRIEEDGISCTAENFVMTQNITVNITAMYRMPKVFTWLGLPETYDLSAQAVMTVSDQDEFIRNVDYVDDLMIRTGIKDKISEVLMEPVNKLKGFIDKIFK